MLRPTKHSNPKMTVLPVAGQILAHLRRKRTESLATLQQIVTRPGQEYQPLLVPAIALLFLLGLVKYRRKNDSIEYVGP